MLRNLVDVLKGMEGSTEILISAIANYSQDANFTYYVNGNFKDILDLENILRVDEEPGCDDDLMYINVGGLDGVIDNMMDFSSYNYDELEDYYDGLELVNHRALVKYLKDVKEFIENNR